MQGQYEELQNVCDKLLELFAWEEDKPSEIRFLKASALSSQGKKEESLKFCEEWYKVEEDNISALAALIYAKIGMKDLEGAEKLVKQCILDNAVCNEDNDIIFTAASVLYKAKGDKKEEKRINKAIQKYKEELEEYFMEMEDCEEFDFLDEELPFS